jgi:hypothetical protein
MTPEYDRVTADVNDFLNHLGGMKLEPSNDLEQGGVAALAGL